MSLNTRLLESIDIVPAWVPGTDIASTATGDWVSLKNYEGCLVVFHKAAGVAGEDPILVLQQATAVAGTSSKALNINNVYAKVGATALTGVSQFTKYTGTAAASMDLVSTFGTDILADVGESLIVIDVRASDLDVANGFDCINLINHDDGVTTANLSDAFYILYGARYSVVDPVGLDHELILVERTTF